MKNKLTLLLLICFLNLNAQEIKTFTGELKHGTQIYTYYEGENGDLIKDGKFTYEKNEYGLICTINGEFKNNKRIGVWKFDITYNNSGNDQTSYLGFKRLTMLYKSGLPDGYCNYSSELQVRNKKYLNGQMQWGNYDAKTISTISLNYKDGKLVGAFNIKDGISKETSMGSFNNNSYAEGIFKTQDDLVHNITTAFYKNGIPIEFSVINSSTGKSEYNLKDEPIKYKYHNDLANNIISPNELKANDDSFFKLDTVHSIAPIASTLKTFIYQDDFLFYEIGGDLNYKNGDILYGGNNAIIVVKLVYRSVYDNADFQSAKGLAYSKEYGNAIKKLEMILEQEKLSKEHNQLVVDLIQEYKNNAESEYKNVLIKADNFFNTKDFKSAIKEYELATKLKPQEEYPINQLKEIESLQATKVSTNKNVELNNKKVDEIVKLYENGLEKKVIYNAFKSVYQYEISLEINDVYENLEHGLL